ncbi:MAG: TonB-dependent receptor [Ignavibacteria bacterium]|jgi:outer membrane receptor protein involved in Fe transport|nr:TonB-dependent receptor [Ignavibacteria bacterium]MCU7503553.1 TonB-dependent receptor [Ignavibacteria bacterium]MCU7516793.1 TonB-dependent receptor [Ignavibacteria bacterium]
MHKFISIISLLLALFATSSAQSGFTTIKGKVTDEKGDALSFANVVLKETNNGSVTDNNGNYSILAKHGIYTIEVSFVGYDKVSEKVTLEGKTLEKNFRLKSTSFLIGGIEVVANNEFIPVRPETKTTVSSGEIEHIQAASLNDVMKLTPGVETTNPTLNGVEKATIRGGDALGTQIVLDGIPVTNNANMQVGIGYSTANSGIDLRSIPAENIKEVEIIRGIPSAQYGDLADGLMIVKTKSTAEPFRAKYKYNPQINELNFSGGLPWGDWIFNTNLNLASSDRDIRIEGDGYTRIAGQVSAERETGEYSLKNIFYVTRSIDESKEKPEYASREAWYNRDLNLKYTGNFSRTFSSFSSFNLDVSASYTRQNSHNQQIVSRDNVVITDQTMEGTVPGRIVFGSYLGEKWIKGDVWNLYADANYNFRFFTDEFLHSWVAGINWRDDFNKGAGIIFDPLYPPSATIPAPRLRSYDELPQYNIVSLYAEDRITGRFIRPFTLQVGLRYEVYRPDGFDIKGLWGKGDLIKSYNGSFANPRINFSFSISENTQLRLSYGVTSKAPPMGMIFAQQKYYDIVDTVSVVNPAYADSNFALISTYIRPQANEYLKGYTQKKYEASLDQQFTFGGITMTGYFNNSENMFQSLNEPTVFYKKSFPSWPDESQSFVRDSVLDSYSSYQNNAWEKVRGIELSFRSRKIPVINTIFKFDASYSYQEDGSRNGYYFSTARFSDALGIRVIPMYNDVENFNKRLLLNYRFEIQTKSLGMWITLHIQQLAVDIDGRRNYADTLAVGYFTQKGELIRIPESERGSEKYLQLRRSIESFELNDEDRPNKWLLNLKVSKSLWDGASVSFFVNNFLNNQPLYKSRRRSPDYPSYERRNPDIYYGIEFSTALGGTAK